MEKDFFQENFFGSLHVVRSGEENEIFAQKFPPTFGNNRQEEGVFVNRNDKISKKSPKGLPSGHF